ncbi:unnamed protein product [Rhizoctonia solani]|uniref:HMG box domain-containing protein n=1 Tax=Rhizoctonia solani TaxID=456999 RepID=A0A8H3HLC5_9AGAM|nr:unnamed protein product [Rhizoctonia solani]
MSLPTKNETSTPPPMMHETLEEGALVPSDPTTALIGVLEPLQTEADGPISRRPRNPFILFRTWYIKQGHLKQVTSSGSELSKITGKLWKAMHEDDRKFWAEQARLEREASQGRTYAPIAPSKPRGVRNARKRASIATGLRYDPLATRVPNPTDERMDSIVQLIIAGKTGDELGGELRKKELKADKVLSSSPAIELPTLPLLAPVPRSARSSVSFDALEFQSQLSLSQSDQNSPDSLSPGSSLQDLPMTPEQSLVPSGYSTPQTLASRRGSAALVTQVEPSQALNAMTDFTFGMASFHDHSISTETWSLTALDANVTSFQPQPAPTTYKEYAEAPHLVQLQGWNCYSTPVPVNGLNYPPGNYEVPGHPNYASYGLAPTATWHGSEFVSPFDVPGHTLSVHAGDLCWPPEWLNDCY